MKMIGTSFNRLRISLIVAVLVVTIAIPGQSVSAQTPDEFDGPGLDTSTWTETFFETGLTSIEVSGGALRISVPSGDSYTFSSSNLRAPRVLQEISDEDFSVEVKFDSSMDVYEDVKIQGILVYDSVGDQWLRFDFNTDADPLNPSLDSLNTYIGYINPDEVLEHIDPVSPISTSNSTDPLFMRVQYTANTGQWRMFYRIGDTGNFTEVDSFTESNALGSSGFSFAPTHIGIFAGSTGDDQPGHVMIADYFRNVTPAEPPPPMNERLYLPIIFR